MNSFFQSDWAMNPDTVGVYGNSYVKRAISAEQGSWGERARRRYFPLNLGDESGKPLDGLPAPKEPFNRLMRMYAPKSDVLTGKWNTPAVAKFKDFQVWWCSDSLAAARTLGHHA